MNGKTTRRTLGKASGPGAISADAAKKLKINVSSELQQGVDRSAIRKSERLSEKSNSITLEKALTEYVKNKRRTKDNLPLKARTQSDYLGMISAPRPLKNGLHTQAGMLFSIAHKPLHKITAIDIRRVYKEAQTRGQRRADYALQTLRAVLNWYGVQIEDNPLTNAVAGKDRIRIASPRGKPNPIRPEMLGAWWQAACQAGNEQVGGSALAGDYYRFRLLTGTRGTEILSLKVSDVDLIGGRIMLWDTKNRSDHPVMLSKQAHEIAAKHCQNKKFSDRLFPISDPRKTLKAINKSIGLDPLAIKGHDLRDTFASIAEPLVSYLTLKRMINHADTGDVTSQSYVATSEAQLRDAWQKVADFITAAGTQKNY